MKNVTLFLTILVAYLLCGGYLGWFVTVVSRKQMEPLHWAYALLLPATFLIGFLVGVAIRFFSKG